MSGEDRAKTEGVRYVATELDYSIEVRKFHDPLRRLTRAEAEELARRANAYTEAVELLRRVERNGRSAQWEKVTDVIPDVRAFLAKQPTEGQR